MSFTSSPRSRRCRRSVYEIVDDRPISMTEIVRAMAESSSASPPLTLPAWLRRLFAPILAGITALRLPLSNEKARKELDWRPAFPTRDGLADMTARAA